MESKYIEVKASKVEKTIDYYTSFGWTLAEDKEELSNGKVGLTFERDKKRLNSSYGTIRKGESLYRKISRPYPLGALINLGIACVFLVLYFVLRQTFAYYIIFLYASLTFFAVALYLLIVFIIIIIHVRMLLNKIVYSVGLEAGTLREYPLKNNILEEEDDTWAIADHL